MSSVFQSDYGRIQKTDAVDLHSSITVTVGTDGSAFTVHEAVICGSSDFFRSAMKPEWASARADPRVVDLSDEEPDIFGLYLHWLYFKTLPTVLKTKEESDKKSTPEFKELAQCYVLGEKLMDAKFKNAVLSATADAIENQPYCRARFPGPIPIIIIYGGTTEGSPARQLLVDIWAHEGSESWNMVLDSLPAQFILDLTKALFKTRRAPLSNYISWKYAMENYHEN